jgi:hypothetical protein
MKAESDEEAVKSLEKAWREAKLPVKNTQDVAPAEEKLKRTTELLHCLICIFDPKQRTLPPSPIADLSSLIKSTKDELEKVIEPQGTVATAGNVIQRICVKVTPFLKVFLSVAVQGSSVLPRLLSSILLSDTNSQSVWLVMQWAFYAYQGQLLLTPN